MKKNFTKFSQQIALAVCLLGWLVGGQQSAVASKVYFDAGAVCEAPIASEANKLSLNHERIVNTSIDPVWVICPVHADTASNNDSFGWVTTYFSPSDSSAGDEIRCIWRRMNWLAPGKTLAFTDLSATRPAGGGAKAISFPPSNTFNVFEGNHWTVSCLLAPGTGIVSIGTRLV